MKFIKLKYKDKNRTSSRNEMVKAIRRRFTMSQDSGLEIRFSPCPRVRNRSDPTIKNAEQEAWVPNVPSTNYI